VSALQASIVFVEDSYPDLTVGAINWRRFAPHDRLFFVLEFVFVFFTNRDLIAGFVG
jgi:hypothetical protein